MSDMTSQFVKGILAQVDQQTDQRLGEFGMLTLGELDARLESVVPELPIKLDSGTFPGEIMSYRGYYRFPAVEPSLQECTVGEFHKVVKDAIGRTFEGYKGGDFKMTRHSPLWVSSYGDASGRGIVGVTVDDDQVILKTAVVDADAW